MRNTDTALWKTGRVTVRLSVLLTILLIPVILPTTAGAGGLVRVSTGATDYEGKVIALTPTTCSLLDRQGQLVHLNVRSLQKFQKISTRYQPLPTAQLRDELRKEFSGSYEVAGTTHYLVSGPSGRASRYAELFESIYRDVERFYRVRGFRVQTPDVPLIAVVFGSQQEFAHYCLRDQVPPSPGLLGYYSLKTNRVALFDDDRLLSQNEVSEPFSAASGGVLANAAIAGDTVNTIIHETTHQVGYNIGVHSRLGGTPTWVVEGLATVLEPSGMRSNKGRQLISDRLNPERSSWFQQRHRPSRSMGNLAKLVASEEWFHRQTLNSYSESWALTFFLLENASRRKDFVTYLQKISERPPLQEYPPEERLADFQSVFGDISRLEVEFIRYMDRM
ncbi:MAG: DUF1570 domain-containing protein [Fuerstiella sp.]